MRIVICDMCHRKPPGGSLDVFRVAHADGDRWFDVCGACMEKPFCIPPSMRATVTLAPGEGSEVFVSTESEWLR